MLLSSHVLGTCGAAIGASGSVSVAVMVNPRLLPVPRALARLLSPDGLPSLSVEADRLLSLLSGRATRWPPEYSSIVRRTLSNARGMPKLTRRHRALVASADHVLSTRHSPAKSSLAWASRDGAR